MRQTCPYMHLTFVTFKILSLNLSFLLMCSFVYLMHENWVFATSIKVVAKPEMEFGDINRRNICGGRSEEIVVFSLMKSLLFLCGGRSEEEIIYPTIWFNFMLWGHVPLLGLS